MTFQQFFFDFCLPFGGAFFGTFAAMGFFAFTNAFFVHRKAERLQKTLASLAQASATSSAPFVVPSAGGVN